MQKTLYTFSNVWFECACSTCMSAKLADYADEDECPSYHRLTPDHDDQARPKMVELAAGISLSS